MKFYFSEGAFCFQMVGFLKIDYGLGDILWRKTLPEFETLAKLGLYKTIKVFETLEVWWGIDEAEGNFCARDSSGKPAASARARTCSA